MYVGYRNLAFKQQGNEKAKKMNAGYTNISVVKNSHRSLRGFSLTVTKQIHVSAEPVIFYV